MVFTYFFQSFELLQQNWMKSTSAAPYVNGMGLKFIHILFCANNFFKIIAMIGIFNKASQWVSTAILSERLLRNRVKMLTKMIKVMDIKNTLRIFINILNISFSGCPIFNGDE